MASEIEQNTVSAENQVRDNYLVKMVEKPGAQLKVLFVGNSITRHEPNEEIGWLHDWGMAASDIAKDYVHVTIDLIEKKLGRPVNYCIVHLSRWEKNYWDDSILSDFKDARDYAADIVVLRIGENCFGVRENLDQIDLFPHFNKMANYFVSNPNAQVVLTSLFWTFPPVDRVIERVWEANPRFSRVEIRDLGSREDTRAIHEYRHKGVADHPNDYGMRIIAERIAETLDL